MRGDDSPLGSLVSSDLMKRLYLLRHAKSSWKDASLSDRDRPLAARGRRAAMAMGQHLDKAGIDPELVLCSPARRARETLERICDSLRGAEVQIEPELYGSDAAQLLGRLRRVPEAVGSVLLVGHNPALQDLALDLALPGSARSEVAEKYPTGALVELEFPVETWVAVHAGGGELVGFVRPRDL
jgi:phosphohistidine phosphatase